MNYENYDPDLDVEIAGGAIGIALAEARFRREGYSLGRLGEKTSSEGFLSEAGSLSRTSFGERSMEKGRILRKYFVRFRKGEKQDLDNRSALDTGVIFNRMVNSYRNRH